MKQKKTENKKGKKVEGERNNEIGGVLSGGKLETINCLNGMSTSGRGDKTT